MFWNLYADFELMAYFYNKSASNKQIKFCKSVPDPFAIRSMAKRDVIEISSSDEESFGTNQY